MSDYLDLQERLADLVRQSKVEEDKKSNTESLVAETKAWQDLMTVRAEMNTSNDAQEIRKLAHIARKLRGDADLFD
jgi:hypothetical protein